MKTKKIKNSKNTITGKALVITTIMYIISAVLIFNIFILSQNFFDDYFRKKAGCVAYTEKDLFDSFSGNFFSTLYDQTEYNKFLGAKIDSEQEDYYNFACLYQAAFDYNMYKKAGNTQEAEKKLNEFNEYNHFSHKIFEQKVEDIKVTYGIK